MLKELNLHRYKSRKSSLKRNYTIAVTEVRGGCITAITIQQQV